MLILDGVMSVPHANHRQQHKILIKKYKGVIIKMTKDFKVGLHELPEE